MRTWRCHGCGHTVRVSHEELAEIGTPICGQPGCPNADDEMELLPEPAHRRTEVHLIVPCKRKDAEDAVGALEKDGHILCRTLGRRKDDCRVVVNPPKPQLRLIVEMFGGAVEDVYKDNPDVQVTDIVFVEEAKYLEGEDGRDDRGNLRFPVEAGPLKGKGIHAHLGDPEVAGPDLFEPVMETARRRIQAAQRKKPEET